MSAVRPPTCASDCDEPFVFVSYAHDDAERVYPLLARLAGSGVRVWYDESINPGESWREEIGRAVDNCALFLYFVTPASATSRHCQRECGFALDLDKPMLIVHLAETQLSHGLTLSLADQQALLAYRYSPEVVETKLLESVDRLLGRGATPPSRPAPRTEAARPRRAPWVWWSVCATLALVLSVVVWSVWRGNSGGGSSDAVTRSAALPHPVVAVAALRNLTGDPKLDWLSEGVANLVRDELAESSHLIVASAVRWQAVLRDDAGGNASSADILESAALAGIDYVVSGEFLAMPDGLLLTARLSDVRTGVDIAPHRADRLDAQALLGEYLRLALMTKRGLGVPHTETMASFSADFAVKNMAAYEMSLSGIGYFLAFDYRAAERAFRSALDLAPDFHMARYRLAHVRVASGDTAGGLATLDGIPADAPLTRRERAYVDGARALFARDTGRAKAIYEGLLKELPFDVEARWLLALSHDIAFEDQAAIDSLRRLLEQEPQNDYLWSYLGETYLRLGDYPRARESLGTYLTLKPKDPFGFTVLGELEVLTGDAARAAAYFTHALELEPGFVRARMGLAHAQLLDGRRDEAERGLRALVGDPDVPAADRIDAAFDLSALLRAESRFADALQPLEALEPLIRKESIREAMALSERAIALGELGRFDEAERLVALAVERSPALPTRYLFARGSLAIMRGDAAATRAAAAEMRALVVPQDNPQDAALVREALARAAAYLDGMAALLSGETGVAVETLERVVAMPGYPYALYALGLARAQYAAGELDAALETVGLARTQREPGDIRLDLEIDRVRAVALEAEIRGALERG